MHRQWSGQLESFVQDVRYGCRAISKTPVVSTAAILSLALGIGANTAVFSVLDALVLRALPVADPGRLTLLDDERTGRTHWTNPIWEQVRDRSGQFDGAFAAASTRFNLALHGESELVEGLWASGTMFEVLGVSALLGRTLSAEDDRAGGGPHGPAAVISHGFWQRRFGGSPDVVGRSLTVERTAFTIVGVTPPRFFGVEVGRRFDVAIPIGAATLINGPRALEQRSSWWLRVMIRLKPGQTSEAGTALLRSLQPQIRQATLPDDWHPWTLPDYMREPFRLVPAATGDSGLRERYQRPLSTMLVVVGLVLLVACSNLASLLLSRTAARHHEFGLRTALGASRVRIVKQVLTESLLLSTAGALVGLAFAHWGSRLLVRELSMDISAVFLELPLDWRVLGFTGVISIATAVLFGTAPAVLGARQRPIDDLRNQGRGLVSGALGPGHLLIAVQVALSLVLVVAAGLFLRTFSSLARMDLGFDERPVLTATVQIPGNRIDTADRPALFERLLAVAKGVPGVSHAALSHVTPLSARWNNVIELPDGPQLPPLDRLTYFNMVSEGWFETYGIELLAGRDFNRADTPGSLPVAIVNQAFARRFTGGRNPIGTRVKHPHDIVRQVVGYVDDAVYDSLRQPVPPTLYISYRQQTGLSSSTSVSVRAAGGSPLRLTTPLVAELGRVHDDAVITVRPVADRVSAAVTQERIAAALSAVFGALALVLAGLGLYGVTSDAVNRRRTEIGIRIALGAVPNSVVFLLLRRAAALVGVGLIVGTAVSLWASRFVAPLLFGLPARDPLTLAISILVLASIALIAAAVPARRASRIDPMRVLRDG